MEKEVCTIEYKKRDINTRDLRKLMLSLNKHYVSVGIHKKEGSKVISISNGRPFTMLQNACIQEFEHSYTVQKTRAFQSPYTGKWFYLKKGTEINIPARPFVRIFTLNKTEQKLITNAFKQALQMRKEYKEAEQIYKMIGDVARLRMKERFLDNSIKPKNAEMTVEYKGFDKPLVLTGKMADSIKSEVH